MNFDLFISHASEDKPEVVRPLVEKLKAMGLRVWFDEFELTLGDSLRRSIDKGLAGSRFGIVILSPDFFRKEWPTKELDALVSREDGKEKVILPVWHKISKQDVVNLSPLLADKVAASTASGIANVAQQIFDVVNRSSTLAHGRTAKVLKTTSTRAKKNRTAPQNNSINQSHHRKEIEALMENLRKAMSDFIPDFEIRFPRDIKEAAFLEARKENLFKIRPARALVFGGTSVGKTTTINLLLNENENIFPTTGELTCTKSLACGEHKGGLVFYDSPGIGDEYEQINITRTALGVTQLAREQIDYIDLIDLTDQLGEGPQGFSLVDTERDQISLDYVKRTGRGEKTKRYDNVDEFRSWAESCFDFVVFVVSSARGLPRGDAELFGEFYHNKSTKTQVFKVYNVFDGQFSETTDGLSNLAKTRLEQAVRKLEDENIPNNEDWIILDSQNSSGIDGFIQAFADSLPVDVLRSLDKVIRDQYSSIIYNKITFYYFDYLAQIASLVAVFPVDYSKQGKEFLESSVDSLATMAEYMFGSRSILSAASFEGMVDDLKKKRRKSVYTTKRTVQSRADNYKKVLSAVNFVGQKVNDSFDIFKTLKLYDEHQEFSRYDYKIGGVPGILTIVSLGLTFKKIYSEEDINPEFSSTYFTSNVLYFI